MILSPLPDFYIAEKFIGIFLNNVFKMQLFGCELSEGQTIATPILRLFFNPPADLFGNMRTLNRHERLNPRKWLAALG
jgi:hypothetical protein